MHNSLRRARLVFNLIPASICSPARRSFSFLRSGCLPSISNVSWSAGNLSRRSFSSKSDSLDELFNYTSGRWLVNENLRLSERKREFDVDELCRLAAQSVGRSPQDVDKIVKHHEDGSNRTFLITMHDGFQMVARIPYPIVVPKFYTIASEVATMRFLRSSGLPIPEVYDYSPSPDNAAKTEYIFMEHIRGTNLGRVWYDLEDSQIISVLRQLVQLEFRMMAITFPAGGSLYYAEDLEKAGGKTGIPLEDDRFCVGPYVDSHLWDGRRSELDVDRGPYRSVEATLVGPAHKEQAYLERFGKPLQPFHRERREYYHFKEQLPLDHLKNLERYLLIAPSLTPENPAFHRFHIRHPDLHPGNVIVTTSPDSNELEVVGLNDWQCTSILPQFLHADIPPNLQNYDDPFSSLYIPPSLPANMDELNPDEQFQARELYLRRLVHFHYVKLTKMYNRPHFDAWFHSLCSPISQLFILAGDPWKGETRQLKILLIEAMELWEELAKKGVPCPIVFEPEDIRDTKKLHNYLEGQDELYKKYQEIAGFKTATWVPNDHEHYEKSKELAAVIKQRFFDMIEEYPEFRKKRQEYEANWCLDDWDETDYM